jgi:hypothetical protein
VIRDYLYRSVKISFCKGPQLCKYLDY